jgi:hypothetical protein
MAHWWLLNGGANGVEHLRAGIWSASRPIALLKEDLLAFFHEVLSLCHGQSSLGYGKRSRALSLLMHKFMLSWSTNCCLVAD